MSVKYFIHMDGILLSMWRIFGLRGKNIPKRFYVVHKKFVYVLMCSLFITPMLTIHARTIATLTKCQKAWELIKKQYIKVPILVSIN